MHYRQLGSSELQVSAIALGTWLTTSGGLERALAIACIHRALDLGITFIDTANVYGRGASEIVLAEAQQVADAQALRLAEPGAGKELRAVRQARVQGAQLPELQDQPALFGAEGGRNGGRHHDAARSAAGTTPTPPAQSA